MNKQLSIAKVSLPLPVDRLFDYYIPKNLSGRVKRGVRANIRFNNKNTTGYVINFCLESRIKKLNPIINLVDQSAVLTTCTLQLAKKIKEYYFCSLGEAIETMLPNALKRSKNIETVFSFADSPRHKNKKCQTIYIQDFSNAETLNYFKEEIIKRLKDKKRIIFVVPEAEMINSASEYFSAICDIKIGIWHSKLSKNKMLELWDNVANDRIDMVMGTRSCIFAPLKNLDLIIIKDEDSYSHKDDQVPYYHSVKIAQIRSEIEQCDVILSSAIPSLKTYQLILGNEIAYKNTENSKPLALIQNMGINFKDRINIALERELAGALEKKEKTLVFLNRKGFATFIYCKKCSQALNCNRCSSNLIFDYSQKLLKCPNCSYKTKMVEICPKCNSAYVRYGGLGVEKLESVIKRNFPLAKVFTLDELLKTNPKETDYDIVIATKKVLNLLDFKTDVTIVWDLDSLLNIGNFSSSEDTYRLLSKLLLITARKMIICSSLNHEFYLLKNLEGLRFKDFYDNELKTRKELKLPPYYHLGLISIRGDDKKNVQNISSKLYSNLERLETKNINVSNFYTNLRSRIREKFYNYILVKSKNTNLLKKTIKNTISKFRSNKIIITVNIDPV